MTTPTTSSHGNSDDNPNPCPDNNLDNTKQSQMMTSQMAYQTSMTKITYINSIGHQDAHPNDNLEENISDNNRR
jgi:hypothetical protein